LNTRSGIMKEERREDRGAGVEVMGEMGKGAVAAAAGAVARVWVLTVGVDGVWMTCVARRATIMRLIGNQKGKGKEMEMEGKRNKIK
jgi:hypothetical protein